MSTDDSEDIYTPVQIRRNPEFYYHDAPITEKDRVKNTFGDDLPELPPSPYILDAGCSDGLTTAELLFLYPGSMVTGVDIDQESVERATRYQKKLIDEGKVRIVPVDAYERCIIPESYHAIFFMNNLLISVKNMPRDALTKIMQNQLSNLKNEGYLLISVYKSYIILKKVGNSFRIYKRFLDHSLEEKIRLKVESSINLIEKSVDFI